jgi:hypothetical protein
MTDYLKTLHLLEASGFPVANLGAGTITYLLTKEHKTPEQAVQIVLGSRVPRETQREA